MLSLQEATQLDFAGGLPDMDGGFGFDVFWPESVCNAMAAGACELPAVVDHGEGEKEEEEEERRRRLRRKISNRESARRSRARKLRRVEELELAAAALPAENRALAARLDSAARRAHAVRCDNARLLAEAATLRRRLGVAQGDTAVLLGLSRMLRATVPAAASGGGGMPSSLMT